MPAPRSSLSWPLVATLAGASACRPAAPTSPPALPATQPPGALEPEPPARVIPEQPPASAQITATGVSIHVLRLGDPDAPKPRSGDQVEVRYAVWDGEGTLVGRSRPDHTERLSMAWLPPGWAEAMITLNVGAHAHIWVPPAQAYPDHPNAPQGELTIDVELVALHTTVSPHDNVPLTRVPDYAQRTDSGLAYVVLRAGAGVRRPTPDGRVTVHYEGWTADGNRFDSSYERGKPATFPLAAVIAGWQEAVPLMVEGDKTRFWIPEDLAYGQAPGKPNGMLIFDVELIRIED